MARKTPEQKQKERNASAETWRQFGTAVLVPLRIVPRASLLFIGGLLALAVVTAGCGGANEGASDSSVPVESIQAPAPAPTPARPNLVAPDDNQQGALWVRASLGIYEHAYQECGDLVDIQSPSYRPENVLKVSDVENALTERARLKSERAAWVAFTGCQDGISDYPFPGVQELAHLQRNP